MNNKLELRNVPIHRSLIRPIMLGSAERELVIINMTFVAVLVFGVGLTKLTMITAFLLLTVGQFSLTMMGKHDPQMSRVYIRHTHYKAFYAAHSSRLARTPIVHPSIKIG